MRNFMKTMFLKQREKFDQETRVRNANFQIPDDIKLVENIPYLNDSCPAHTMDIYRPASLVPSRPVIINVHGGGLMEGRIQPTILHSALPSELRGFQH